MKRLRVGLITIVAFITNTFIAFADIITTEPGDGPKPEPVPEPGPVIPIVPILGIAVSVIVIALIIIFIKNKK